MGIGDWRPTYFVDMGTENCMRVGMGMVFVREDWNWLAMGSVVDDEIGVLDVRTGVCWVVKMLKDGLGRVRTGISNSHDLFGHQSSIHTHKYGFHIESSMNQDPHLFWNCARGVFCMCLCHHIISYMGCFCFVSDSDSDSV